MSARAAGHRAAARICAGCGRGFAWRKRWARCWDQVRYCSERCRRHRPGDLDRRLERTILEELAARAPGATICPSEAARALQPLRWRDLMEAVRCAARRLAARGELEIVQGGRLVDADTMRGPIRLRRAQART